MKETKNQYRDLLLTLLLLGIIYWYKRWEELLLIALMFILLGLALQQVRVLNHSLWKSITQMMQLFVQPVIGTVIFFLILTPIGLLFQVFKKKKVIKDSTFVKVERKFNVDFFQKQW